MKALGHPVRRRILEAMTAGQGQARSPVALAAELDVPVPRVAYHVKELSKVGLLRPAGQRPRRGTMEHFYTPAPGLKRAVRQIHAVTQALEDAAENTG
jgi:hypothetical protein